MRYKAPKGTQDLIFDRAGAWLEFVARANEVFSAYGYEPIQTPVFESTELFTRSVGETSDVASKELFSVRSMGAMQAMREGTTLKSDQVLSLAPRGHGRVSCAPSPSTPSCRKVRLRQSSGTQAPCFAPSARRRVAIASSDRWASSALAPPSQLPMPR